MIEESAFKHAWSQLLKRFGRDMDPGTAAAYYEYLSPQMDTAAFLSASQAIWATAKWFPRPADFVLQHAAGDWAIVLQCIAGYHGPDWAWIRAWEQLSTRGKTACKAFGGMDVIKATYEKQPLTFREAWTAAYEQTAATDALALPAPAYDTPQLKAAI